MKESVIEDCSVKVPDVVSNRCIRKLLQVVIDVFLILSNLHEVVKYYSNSCQQIAVNWI